MYDGTLAENWQALITFQQMIILCDDSGVIDLTPSAISRRTGIPIEHIEAGIKTLESDDPYSRTPDENGRRIVRLDDHRPWGWRIVNHQKYKQMASYEDKKKADRERIAAKREADKIQDVAECRELSHEVADVAHTDTDTNIYKNSTAFKNAAKVDGNDFLITRRKRKLIGQRWEAFKLFWEAFGYKKGKREAADAWLDIPHLTNSLLDEILSGAKKECQRRPQLFADGKTPKMAQGWISAARWEDEDYTPPEKVTKWIKIN